MKAGPRVLLLFLPLVHPMLGDIKPLPIKKAYKKIALPPILNLGILY